MQGTRIREEKSRMFMSLYGRRRMLVVKTTWFLDNGIKEHKLFVFDVLTGDELKGWSWVDG